MVVSSAGRHTALCNRDLISCYTNAKGSIMIRTYEAIVDDKGNIRVKAPLQLISGHRVLVTILDEPAIEAAGTALLSEDALADRSRPEEDTAWFNLFTYTLGAAYGENEPDYPLTSIKEPNPTYEGG